jgi:NTE family protein
MRRPTALVTTFGLGRTPVQVGMLRAVRERGYEVEYVVGTSLGAVNAAACAAQCDTSRLLEFWEWMYEEVMPSPLRAITKGITARQARKQQTAVRERLADMMPEEFADLPIPVVLVGTDLQSGSEVQMSEGNLLDAVLASAALPGVFPPVEVDGRLLIDGGLVAGVPLRPVPDRIRSILLLDAGQSAVPEDTTHDLRWWEVGALSYAHLIRGQAAHALQVNARRRQVVVLSTAAGGLLEFTDPGGYAAAGYEAASEQLDELPSRMRRGLYGLPPGLDESEALADLVP